MITAVAAQQRIPLLGSSQGIPKLGQADTNSTLLPVPCVVIGLTHKLLKGSPPQRCEEPIHSLSWANAVLGGYDKKGFLQHLPQAFVALWLRHYVIQHMLDHAVLGGVVRLAAVLYVLILYQRPEYEPVASSLQKIVDNFPCN
jgi:hypothetical protein